jgi:thiol:disulfide interchange protein DsbC
MKMSNLLRVSHQLGKSLHMWINWLSVLSGIIAAGQVLAAEPAPVARRAAVEQRSLSEMTSSSQAEAKMLAQLKAAYPATRFTSVQQSPTGLYEVVMGKNVAYVGSDVRYFVFGHLYDMQEQRDLTANLKVAVATPKVDIGEISTGHMVRIPSPASLDGAAGVDIYLFSDPHCGYCREHEAEISTLPGLNIHILPVALLPGSMDVAASIMCSNEVATAWRGWMRSQIRPLGKDSGMAACRKQVEHNTQLASRLGVQGTPTTFAASGRRFDGKASRREFTAWLQGELTTRVPATTARNFKSIGQP